VNRAHIGEGFQAFYNQHMGTDPRTPCCPTLRVHM
jgi:hypothetical protein